MATHIEFGTTLVAQPTESTCWAASIAMLLNSTAEAVCTQHNMDLNTGYGWDQILPAAEAAGLHQVGAACGAADYWAQLLTSPIWVVEIGAPYHAVVVDGLYIDDAGQAQVKILNPWPPGSGAVQWVAFDDFERDFELGAGAKANLLQR